MGYLIFLALFILLQIILYVGAKKIHEEKLTKEEENKKILKSYNRVRSIFINFSVTTIVIFISSFTDEEQKNIFISHFSNDNFLKYFLMISFILLIIFPFITCKKDIEEKRISKKELCKNIFEEYAICFLSVGFIYSFIVQTLPALILAICICIVSILVLLFI